VGGIYKGLLKRKDFFTQFVILFTDYAYEIMKDALGFDCRSFSAWESKELAFEQMACFKQLAEKYIN
jgi:hypothetical protein